MHTTICTRCNGEGDIFHDGGPRTNCPDCEGFGEYESTYELAADCGQLYALERIGDRTVLTLLVINTED